MGIQAFYKWEKTYISTTTNRILVAVFCFSIFFFVFLVADIPFLTAKGCTTNFPVCVNALLDKRDYFYEKWIQAFNNGGLLISTTQQQPSCRLLNYTKDIAVKCFDLLSEEQDNQVHVKAINQFTTEFTNFHLIFIGDSRIRQQFFNFLKLVPDYDRLMEPASKFQFWQPFHGDLDVYSTLLRLRISFKWHSLINDSLLERIHYWASSNASERPTILFLSIEIYYMLQKNGADFKLYYHKVMKLGEALGQLANVSQVIWLNQYPTMEFYGKINDSNTEVHTQKIHRYNEAVRLLFRDFKNIRIWDSSNLLAEDYVRACNIYEREIPYQPFIKIGIDPLINWKPFINCLDFVHIGYAALSEATQLLYNDICNKKMAR